MEPSTTPELAVPEVPSASACVPALGPIVLTGRANTPLTKQVKKPGFTKIKNKRPAASRHAPYFSCESRVSREEQLLHGSHPELVHDEENIDNPGVPTGLTLQPQQQPYLYQQQQSLQTFEHQPMHHNASFVQAPGYFSMQPMVYPHAYGAPSYQPALQSYSHPWVYQPVAYPQPMRYLQPMAYPQPNSNSQYPWLQ